MKREEALAFGSYPPSWLLDRRLCELCAELFLTAIASGAEPVQAQSCCCYGNVCHVAVCTGIAALASCAAQRPRAALVASLQPQLILYALKYQAWHAFVQPPPELGAPARHTVFSFQFLGCSSTGLASPGLAVLRSGLERSW